MASSNKISAGYATALRPTGDHCVGAGGWGIFGRADRAGSRSPRRSTGRGAAVAGMAENCHFVAWPVEVVASQPSHGQAKAQRIQAASRQRRLIAGLTASSAAQLHARRLGLIARGAGSPLRPAGLAPGVASASRQHGEFSALACPLQCLNDLRSGQDWTMGQNGSGPKAVLSIPTNGVGGAGADAGLHSRSGLADRGRANSLCGREFCHGARAPFRGAKRPSCSRAPMAVNRDVQTLVDNCR